MSKQKNQHKNNNQTSEKKSHISVLIPCTSNFNLNIINKTLSLLKEATQHTYECLLLISKDKKNSIHSELHDFSQQSYLKQKVYETPYKTKLIEKGISEAQYDNVIIIDPHHLEQPVLISDLLDKIKHDVEGIIQLKFNKKRKLFIYNKNVAKYLFSNLSIKNNDYYHELLYKIKRLPINIVTLDAQNHNPFKNNAFKIPFIKKTIYNLLLFITWFFIEPVKDTKTKAHKTYPFIKEQSIFRFTFASIAILLFFLMPFLSLNSSISGDEFVHYKQAQNYYDFFKSAGQDTSYMSMKPAYAYGMSFDVVTYTINQWFNIENTFQTRHIINSLTGWIAILFAGLLGVLLGGWRTGIISMLLVFLTPRFIGHSFNNPKDIPFAAAYIFALYYIIKFLKKYPNHSILNLTGISIGIAAAISIRIGGLLLIAYLFLFGAFYYLHVAGIKSLFSQKNRKTLHHLLFTTIIVSAAGYLLGLILWPYGISNPISHPLKSLEIMTQFPTTLRQLFEGNIYWSDFLPWYYIPKYILITTPIVILIGFLLYIVFIRKKIIKREYLYNFFLVFSFAFPIIYIIYKGSNVYGGWRHALFIWPSFVVATALGYEKLLRFFQNKRVQYVMYVIVAALAIKPAIHIIKHHPYEYIYFNEFVGGVNGAYGDYEMDYYGHSLRPAAQWLINNVIKDKLEHIDPDDKMIVCSNYGQELKYNLKKYNDKVKVKYCRYYERGNFDWDYAIFVNTYLNPYQQKHGIWPPGKTIHSINVNDAIICAVQERKTTLDLKGYQALQNNNPKQAIIHLRKAIEITPHNEAAHVNLCRAYLKIGMYNQSIKTAYKCLKFYPDYDQILNLLGIAYMQKNELDNALATFNKLKKVNKKFSSAYYYMGIIYMKKSQPYNAMKYLKQCIQSNQRYKPAYYAMAEILKKTGKPEQAKQYLQVANSF